MSSFLVFNRVYRLEICTVSHVGILAQICELLPLYLLSSSPPPPVNNYRSIQSLQCVTGGGGVGLCGEHIQELYMHCVFDQIPNQKNCFTTNTCRQVPLLVNF
jgi:hypothetical protein